MGAKTTTLEPARAQKVEDERKSLFLFLLVDITVAKKSLPVQLFSGLFVLSLSVYLQTVGLQPH